jgi:hypothetical protein
MSEGDVPPDWQRYAALTVPAGETLAPEALSAQGTLLEFVSARIDWAQEIPASLLRGSVAVTTLAVGQLALGEKDHGAIARRSVAGALIAEVGMVATRVGAVVSARPATDAATLEGMLLYGEDVAAQYAARFAAARRIVRRPP